MKILIAPDKFKESLTADEVAGQIEAGIKKVSPETECLKIPMADGGEGTVRAIINSTGGKIIPVKVMDPLMREVDSFFGIAGDGETAVIEMAAASGLEQLKPGERNPLLTTSYGTGQLILAALKTGVKKIIIGLGGSATNDGGAGMAEALGVEFSDEENRIIHPRGDNLHRIGKINSAKLESSLRNVEFIIASDVKNVMCGPAGATRVFAPQKGANPGMIGQLEKNLFHYGQLLESTLKKTLMSKQGTGAAGGMAASLVAFLNAEIKPGFEVIDQLTGFESKIKSADIVITGEGKIDSQTFQGKTPWSVLCLAKKYGKPVLAITGHYESAGNVQPEPAFDAVFPIVEYPCTLDEAIRDAPALVCRAAERMMKLIMLNRTFFINL